MPTLQLDFIASAAMAEPLDSTVAMSAFHLQPKGRHHYHPSFSTPTYSTNPRMLNSSLSYSMLRSTPTLSCSKGSRLSSYSHQLTLHEPHNSTNKVNTDNTKILRKRKKRRVFFLDVNSLCYRGSTPSLKSFAFWVSLFFSQVSLTDPVIAVIDGERGNEYRQHLLPSYKANRRKCSPKRAIERSHKQIIDVLQKCNVPVLKMEEYEADDVVATLVGQVLGMGLQAVIASPDKDFKQLLSEDVQIVMPIPAFGRWSFYTIRHYVTQYNCDPQSDLSLRCILGDEVDGVPGIQQIVPGFGRKTALKLLKKHGSLEDLLSAAAVRTVARQYAQDALTKYADILRRNREVLALKSDINIHIEEQWLSARDACNDSVVLTNFMDSLSKNHNLGWQNISYSNV